MIHLTERLRAIADLVPPCGAAADIGTDHGYIPIYLCQAGRIRRAIASDIHEGPAERARIHAAAEHLAGKISVRVGPGLLPLAPGEADGAVIAGMGGLMICRILEEGRHIAENMDWLVLQPQNHSSDLRRWLAAHGYCISRERLVKDGGQIYQILQVRRGVMEPMTEAEEEAGLWRDRREDPLFPEFLGKLIRKREWTIQGVAEDTENAVNAEKRRRAVKEKAELEALLWKYTQET